MEREDPVNFPPPVARLNHGVKTLDALPLGAYAVQASFGRVSSIPVGIEIVEKKAAALSEAEARALAARLVADAFAKRGFKHANGQPVGRIEFRPESFSVSQRNGRWILGASGGPSRGPEASVEFNLDGTEPKAEVNYEWD